ncbi:hypothetical protein BN1723_007130 [Verticillium longisporum]|uniref:Uncharacterized protein n=1 Tax=Verticillium longisporum TaxID=100787 RepID=A0A0G4NJD0_VERLO|nr:hypothetical protein BN1723_007130 [Verticillium longisporum]
MAPKQRFSKDINDASTSCSFPASQKSISTTSNPSRQQLSVAAIFLAVTGIIAAPAPVAEPKAVAEPAPDGYGQYGGYGKYPPSKGGYGQYGGYGKYKKDLSELQDAKE